MNIKDILGELNMGDMTSLEREVRRIYNALPEHQRKELKRAFRENRNNDGFKDMVESYYNEIKENIDHE
jgi:hypothetical protein